MRLFTKQHSLDTNYTRLFDERSFYAAMSADIKAAQTTILIESPFITERRSKEIAHLLERAVRRGVRVTIYTRDPNHHDSPLRIEAISGIEILEKAGVNVCICNDMRHRKVSIIDSEILWEGSLNMLSQNGSKEIMRRTCSQDLCKQMSKFLGVRC